MMDIWSRIPAEIVVRLNAGDMAGLDELSRWLVTTLRKRLDDEMHNDLLVRVWDRMQKIESGSASPIRSWSKYLAATFAWLRMERRHKAWRYVALIDGLSVNNLVISRTDEISRLADRELLLRIIHMASHYMSAEDRRTILALFGDDPGRSSGSMPPKRRDAHRAHLYRVRCRLRHHFGMFDQREIDS